MAVKETLRYPDDSDTVPVRTLRVDVIEGPDTDASCAPVSETLTVGTANGNDLVLTDPTVSRYHVEFERTEEGVALCDHGSTNGTFVGAVRVIDALIPSGTEVRVGRSVLRIGEGSDVHVELHAADHIGELYGRSDKMRRLMAQIGKVAMTEASVLIIGESGTGKELIASAVHERSDRDGKPFITVDCGAMAPNLVASELFGHEKGAFTGADRQHQGAFERAHGGTLFLDEVGELSPELQPTLLGALERKRFRRVGGRQDISVDVRVIAATNRDLRSEVNAGRFRLDLYYRLAVVALQVPPLRDRPEDVRLLIEHFLRQTGHQSIDALFPEELMESLRRHRWPGNVRELRNLVEATVAMGQAPPLDGVQLGDGTPGAPGELGDHDNVLLSRVLALPYKEARASVLTEFEMAYLKHLLEKADGNVAQAARDGRMDRSHLFTLLRRHKLR